MGRQYFKGGTLMAPLPAALVTCGSGDGRNVLTAAWTGIIKETGEFVINLTTSKMARETDLCGMKSGAKLDKFTKCHFETEKAQTVDCPVILQCPVSLECKVRIANDLGSHTMFIAAITGMSVDERYVDSKGKINLQQAGLMAYSHGEYFALGRKLGDFGFSVRKKGAGK